MSTRPRLRSSRCARSHSPLRAGATPPDRRRSQRWMCRCPRADIVVGTNVAADRDGEGCERQRADRKAPSTWTTSATAIATVSSAGLVTGVAPGAATITATIDGKTGTRPVNVIPPPVATVAVSAASSTIAGRPDDAGHRRHCATRTTTSSRDARSRGASSDPTDRVRVQYGARHRPNGWERDDQRDVRGKVRDRRSHRDGG